MTRRIYCRACQMDYQSKPIESGRFVRRLPIAITAPDVHCDLCNLDLTGEIGVAETTWQMLGLETEPGEWEQEFGQRLTIQQVVLADRLAGKPGTKGGVAL